MIRLDKFVNYFQIDPHYFDTTYLLLPNQSEEAYILLRDVMEKTGKAGIGKMTISPKEHIVLVHFYKEALVATLLRYPDEILNLENIEALKDLPEPGEEEKKLLLKIMNDRMGKFDISLYKNPYNERLEALIKSKMAETTQTSKKELKSESTAKSLMESLRSTAESISKSQK